MVNSLIQVNACESCKSSAIVCCTHEFVIFVLSVMMFNCSFWWCSTVAYRWIPILCFVVLRRYHMYNLSPVLHLHCFDVYFSCSIWFCCCDLCRAPGVMLQLDSDSPCLLPSSRLHRLFAFPCTAAVHARVFRPAFSCATWGALGRPLHHHASCLAWHCLVTSIAWQSSADTPWFCSPAPFLHSSPG